MSTRYRLLLVDPVKLRRDRADEALRLRFDVRGVGTLAEAQAAAAESPPHAILLTLRQIDENGLSYGKALREKVGKDVMIVVHGPASPPKSAEERQVLAARHRVDAWMPSMLEPEGIDAAIWGALDRRLRPREAPVRRTLLQRARSVTAADVKEFLTKERKLIDTPPVREGEEPSWLQLLNSELDGETVKKLLTKEIRQKAG